MQFFRISLKDQIHVQQTFRLEKVVKIDYFPVLAGTDHTCLCPPGLP